MGVGFFNWAAAEIGFKVISYFLFFFLIQKKLQKITKNYKKIPKITKK